jgi:hypothetical protein
MPAAEITLVRPPVGDAVRFKSCFTASRNDRQNAALAGAEMIDAGSSGGSKLVWHSFWRGRNFAAA